MIGKGGSKREVLGDLGVNDIAIISGHIAIKYQQSKSIVLFDATASKYQLGETITQNIEDSIFSKQTLPLVSPTSSQLPLLACSFQTNIIKFGFEKFQAAGSQQQQQQQQTPLQQQHNKANSKTQTASSSQQDTNPLRFYVFESDGMFHLWEWNSVDYKWKYIVKVYLPFQRMTQFLDPIYQGPQQYIQQQQSYSSATSKVTASVIGSSQGLQVSWLVDGQVNVRVFNFDQYSQKKKDQIHQQQIPIRDHTGKLLEEMFPLNINISAVESFDIKREWLETINQESTQIQSTKLGIWFITKSFILLWSQRTKLWNITYFKNQSNQQSNSINNSTITTCEIHPPSPLLSDIDTKEQTNTEVPTSTEDSNSSKKSIENVIFQVLGYCRNPSSQELLILEPSGRLFSLEPTTSDKIKLNLISLIHLVPENISQKIIKMVMHQNALILFTLKYSYLYDLKCGKHLSRVLLPIEFKPTNCIALSSCQGIWENGTAGIVWGCGIWSRSEGLWEIRPLSPTNLIQNLSTHKVIYSSNGSNLPKNTIGCAPLTCRQLDMKRLEAKYLLDMALSEQDVELKIQICKSLLPRLENPALVIAILSNLQSESSSKFILDELNQFLEQYDYQENINNHNVSTNSGTNLRQTGNYFLNEDEKSQISKIRNSFLFHTPFNQKMIPLLKEYQKLQGEAITSGASVDQESDPLAMDQYYQKMNSNESLLGLSSGVIDILKRKYPKELLHRLEIALQLNLIEYHKYQDLTVPDIMPPIDPLILHPEEVITQKQGSNKDNNIDLVSDQQSNQQQWYTEFPLFETLCQLYYYEKPLCLIPFVRIVHNTAMLKLIEQSLSNNNQQNGSVLLEVREKDHFLRCLLALPFHLPTVISPSQWQIEEYRIDCRFKLLCAIGHKPNALRFLLNTGRWDKSIQMIKQTHYHDKEIFVLYEIILSYCVEKKDNTKLKQCWEIIPKNFSVFNLLSLLKPSSTYQNSTSTTTTPKQQSPISTSTTPVKFPKPISPSTSANSQSPISPQSTSTSPTVTSTPTTPINIPIYNPLILSPNPSEDLTIDMFRGQLLKMLAININKN
ncbi:hypothetical protein DLAC_01194 [Tieghemostelium lacteum]|uniref:Uncharacterized protein n=1 Tax=Tieghemostelium lacteum TaxID=361077 RepID=A0A152A801_TIELA|nr:hypothetical protein DLAC_01194 [Tieghemostelium lacteum]|eukprot:KYR02362.1 hypothetical protein DLAC_01194 [Tieghemostelium lacteum]